MPKAGARSRERKTSSARIYQVFVSHASADKWIAVMICKELEKRGVTAFRDDRDIAGGDDIPETLIAEIVRSRELLVLLTPKSAKRPWVMLEVGAAWGRRRRIQAVLCHSKCDSIPSIIRSKRAYDLNDLGQCLNDIVARAKKAK